MMSKVKTSDCKQAIVEFLNERPGIVYTQFAEQFGSNSKTKDVSKFEAPSKITSSWKRTSKSKIPTSDLFYGVASTIRSFECSNGEAADYYDDCLRAYVYDDGESIVHIVVQGE